MSLLSADNINFWIIRHCFSLFLIANLKLKAPVKAARKDLYFESIQNVRKLECEMEYISNCLNFLVFHEIDHVLKTYF